MQCFLIYWVQCALEFIHFVWILYLTVTVQFKQCIYTNPQTNSLPRSNHAQCSVSVTPASDTWRQLNLFIVELCSAAHGWMLTADLLGYWRVTWTPLCIICAGVDRSSSTDIKGKHLGNYERKRIIKQLLEAVQALQAIEEIKALQDIQEPHRPLVMLKYLVLFGYLSVIFRLRHTNRSREHHLEVQVRSFPHLEESVNQWFCSMHSEQYCFEVESGYKLLGIVLEFLWKNYNLNIRL